MREIKFRLRVDDAVVGYEKWYSGARNKETRQWTAMPQWLYSPEGEYWNPKSIYHTHKDQYTGLKDKNDTEIYEGDIMHLKCIWRGEMETYWDNAVVFFRNDGWKVGFPPDGQGQSLWYNWILDNNSEVIVNIHENPGLLK